MVGEVRTEGRLKDGKERKEEKDRREKERWKERRNKGREKGKRNYLMKIFLRVTLDVI